MSKNLVAVYGSLRKTMGNHDYFLSKSKLLGEFKTKPEFTLYSLGSYPGLKHKGDTSIVTEVYEVDDITLHRLNGLEGYTPGEEATFYDRIEIETPWGNAFIYIYVNELSDDSIVSSGDWVSFKTKTELWYGTAK